MVEPLTEHQFLPFSSFNDFGFASAAISADCHSDFSSGLSPKLLSLYLVYLFNMDTITIFSTVNL